MEWALVKRGVLAGAGDSHLQGDIQEEQAAEIYIILYKNKFSHKGN